MRQDTGARAVSGSITVFLALTITSIIALVFTLEEGVHMAAVKERSRLVSDIGAESVFAEYNRLLWEEYNILAVDASYGTGNMDLVYLESRMQEYMMDNLIPEERGCSFLRMGLSGCRVDRYGLLSDQRGLPFVKEAMLAVKYGAAESILEAVSKNNQSVLEAETEPGNVDELLADADRAVHEAAEQAEAEKAAAEKAAAGTAEGAGAGDPGGRNAGGGGEGAGEQVQVEEPPENPVELILELKNQGILAQVLANPDALSAKEIPESAPSKRALASGNMAVGGSGGIGDQALLSLYYKRYFGNYRNDLEHEGLQYEWEHVLCGKGSDKQNLEGVVEKLLLLRFGADYASLLADPARQAKALELATAILGMTPAAALVEPLKLGIMAAWAYLESVLDVRLLLSGGKVAVIKNPAEWTSELELFASYFPVSMKAKACENGMGYEDYLMALTAATDIGEQGLRALDILEAALHANADYQQTKVDAMVYQASFHYEYIASPVFFQMVPELSGQYEDYLFSRDKQISYLSDG